MIIQNSIDICMLILERKIFFIFKPYNTGCTNKRRELADKV